MSIDTRWKFASNTFSIVTENNNKLAGEIFRDHAPKLALATTTYADFSTVNSETISLLAAWDAGEQVEINTEAAQLAATLLVEDKLASMTRKPAADENSPIEAWDSAIRVVVAYQGGTYTVLLPHGRETLTGGTAAERVEAMEGFVTRLKAQVAKPALVTLGNTVDVFYLALKALHTAQQDRINEHRQAQTDLNTLRRMVAKQCFRNTGIAMSIWCEEVDNPRIEGLFDMALIRDEAPELPAQATLPTWVPGTRTLSVAALPDRARRMEVWRIGPGGAPELLAVGETGATSVVIPAMYTFAPGSLYQFFMKGRNGRGSGEAGPSVSWTA